MISLGDQESRADAPINLPIGASDPDDDPLEFTAAGLPPGVTIDRQTGTIAGTPTAEGNYTVTVTVTDSFGGVTQISFAWDVFAKSPSTGEGDPIIFLPFIVR